MGRMLRGIGRQIVDLLYPKKAVCMGCDSRAGFEQDWLCDDCRQALAKRWVGAFEELKLDGAAAAYRYQGPAGSVVRRLKYGGVLGLAEPMAEDMLRAYEQILPTGAELVVAVPMYPKRMKRRGFNHAQVLAKRVAERLGLPCEEVLFRIRETVQQARLDGDERRKNLKDAFRADESAAGKRILLVDDVYTTGATARECAAALRAAGARSVSFLSYARGNP